MKNFDGKGPSISVVLTSYQHSKYLRESIQSVLSQDQDDFELIVVDDGSSDGSRQVVEGFIDPRVNYIFQENQGPSAAINTGLERASGEFIALMSGDDVCYPTWLSSQVENLTRTGADVSFCLPSLIDENGAALPDERLRIYFTNNIHDSATALNYFFSTGNALLAPGAVLRTEIVRKVGGFQNHLFQLQDFDYWIRIAKVGNLSVLRDRLIFYRIRDDGNNLGSSRNGRRITTERVFLYASFFRGISVERFRSAFASAGELWFSPESLAEVEQLSWLLLLQHTDDEVRNIGWQCIARAIEAQSLPYLSIGPFQVSALALALSVGW